MSKLRTRTILAVAAAASIATSQVPNTWHSSAEAPTEAAQLDTQRPKVVYAIHTEVAGPGPYENLFGDLSATITANTTARIDGELRFRVTLQSTTNPLQLVTDEVGLPQASQAFPDLPAWTHCSLPPCAEDFELTIELLGSTATTGPIDFSGLVQINSTGDNSDRERSTQTTITVTRLP